MPVYTYKCVCGKIEERLYKTFTGVGISPMKCPLCGSVEAIGAVHFQDGEILDIIV